MTGVQTCALPISDAKVKYNPMNRKWEWATPDAKIKYNPINRSYEYVTPSNEVPYN